MTHHAIPKPSTTILLHQKSGAEPFEFNFNNEKPKINEVEAVVISESKTCVLVELKQSDTVLMPFKCNIPKRFFTSKGSDLKSAPPIISIPIGFNICPVDESEKEYINPLDQPIKTETMETKTPLIYSKILNVMNAIKFIGKNQTAADKEFSFRGIDDITNAIHPLFQQNSIFLTTEIISHQVNSVGKTIVNAKFSFFTSDSSFVASTVCGEAVDKGEFGTAKALSAALKTALVQMFLIPTAENDGREWLVQKQFQQALLKINGGDKELLSKLKDQYRIKADHLKMLEEAHQKKNKS